MIVMILERVTPSLRGEVTRWLIEVKAGVFVGWLSARVRDLLWDKVCQSKATGSATIIYSDNTEQGFSVRSAGDPSRRFVDFEGLFLAKSSKKA